MDSVLLLQSAARLYAGSGRLVALHINHQLQDNAPETEHFCRDLCAELSVPLRVERVSVGGRSIEAAARSARYEVFESSLGENDLLLMAHHGDDQLETVLFRLLRGTGVAGLAGMPRTRAVGAGRLYRPYLDLRRDSLLECAARLSLKWVDDPSNQDESFDRNFLRHSIIPRLKTRWSSLVQRVGHTAESCQDHQQLADRLAEVRFDQIGGRNGELDLGQLSALSLVEQKNLIRWWIRGQSLPVPSSIDWGSVMANFVEAGDDRMPELQGEGFTVRRFQGALYCVPDQPDAPASPVSMISPTMQWGGWRISLVQTSSQPRPMLSVSPRVGGERIRPEQNGPSKPLKNWFQEQQIPPWLRDTVPLVWEHSEGGAELVAVGHSWVSARFAGASPVSGWRLILEPDSN